MTVNTLIKKLQVIVAMKKANGKLKVLTEGCDCYGDVGSLELDGKDLLLKRSAETQFTGMSR